MTPDSKAQPGFRNITAVLAQRNYRLLWSGNLVSHTGDWMDQIALNWLVLETTGSAFYLGMVNLARSGPILALTLFGGVAADRFERRALLMLTQVAGMVLALTLAALVALEQTEIWLIIIIAAARGAAAAFVQPARHSLVSELVPRSMLPSAIALQAMTHNLTKVIGPLLAGVIIASFGTAVCFGINGLSFIAILWTLSQMQFPSRPPREKGEPVLRALAEGFAYLGQNRLVGVLMLVAFIPVLFGQPYLQLLAVFAVEIFHVGPQGVGTMTPAAAVGAMIGGLMLTIIPSAGRSGRVMLSVMLIYGVAICIFSLTNNFHLGLALLVVIGGGQIACNAANNILIQTIVPDQVRGRILSILLLTKGLVQLGVAIVGTLAALIGIRWAMLASAGVVAASALAVLISVPALRRLRT